MSSAPARVVDDVQELWKKSNDIPDRFVRGVDEQLTAAATTLSVEVPVVDFSKLTNHGSDSQEFHNEILKLAQACQEWGFFQVVNHEVELKLMESIEDVAMEFFELPLEEKHKYPVDNDMQ